MSMHIQLDVMPFHSDYANCLEECMISVANFYNRGHILMYSQSWGFSFDIANFKNNGTGNSILDDRGSSIYVLLEHYHGIKMSFTHNHDPQNVMNIILKELMNNSPVGIFMDTFYYSWDPNKNQHGKHWFLISGVDTEKEVFYCTDPYFIQKDSILDFKDFLCGYQGVYFNFELTKSEIFDYDWKELIQNTAEKLQGKKTGKSIFDSMYDFADSIEDTFCIEKEIASCSRVIDMPYYLNLQSVNRGRQQYARFLEYSANRYNVNDLLCLSEKLTRVSYKWDVLRGIITKGIISKNESIIKSKIPDKIREIASIERDILNSLIKAASGVSHHNNSILNNTADVASRGEKINPENCTHLDLSGYFNNKGFGDLLDENSKANLNGAGLFFVTEDLPSEENWVVNDMNFRFPEITEGRNDNIICTNQVLEFTPVNCNYIMLLGTADFGSFKESITLHFVDGSSEEITMGFTELIFEPVYGESTAWEGRACERLNGKMQVHNSTVKIFAKTFNLSKPGLVTGITLPYLPNIHIFAVTMA